MQNKGRWREWKYTWREADVPLVGCFANDTENLFTAGIDNNSEEIKKVTRVTIFYSKPVEDEDVLQSWRCEILRDSSVRGVGLGFYCDYRRAALVSQCDLDLTKERVRMVLITC